MAIVLRPGLTSSNPRNVRREDFEEIIDKSYNSLYKNISLFSFDDFKMASRTLILLLVSSSVI